MRRAALLPLLAAVAAGAGAQAAGAFFADAAEQVIDLRADTFGEWATIDGCAVRAGRGLLVPDDGCLLTVRSTAPPEAGVRVTDVTLTQGSAFLGVEPEGGGFRLARTGPGDATSLTVRLVLSDGSTLQRRLRVRLHAAEPDPCGAEARCELVLEGGEEER